MTDLNNLPISDEQYSDDYEPPTSGFPLLPRATYELRVLEVKPDEESETFRPSVTFEVAEGDLAGRRLTFQRFSPSPFYRPPAGTQMSKEERKRQPFNTSMFLDFLRAFGYKGGIRSLGLAVEIGKNNKGEEKKFVTDPEGSGMRAAQSVEGRTAKAKVDWEGYCKDCHWTTVRGKDFNGKETATCKGYEPKKGEPRVNPNCGAEVEAREFVKEWIFPKKA